MELQRHTKMSQDTQKTNSKIADVKFCLISNYIKKKWIKGSNQHAETMETFECATYNLSGSGV